MDPESSYYVAGIGVAVSLVVLAFTSAVDAALSAIGRHRLNLLQNEDASRAKQIARLLNDPYRFKAAVLCLNAAALIGATACTLYLTRTVGLGWRIGALVLLLFLILTLSEALPKAWATRDPERAARRLSGPMVFAAVLLRPLVVVVDGITRPLFLMVSGQSSVRAPLVTEEELRLLVNVGEEEGLIEPDEREMIEGVFSFGDTRVREVMIPRVDIVPLEVGASLDKALETAIAHGYSRIPVYQDTIDQVVGILYVKDLLPVLRERRSALLIDLLRSAYFVPETMKVAALLKELQAKKLSMAIVVDEYGGTAGLATTENLLEEIVGDLQDEYDTEEPNVQQISDGELIADARASLDDINDIAGLHLHAEESDRLGGLVYERLGQVPHEGDTVELPDGVTIRVLSVEGLRPRRLQITYPVEAEAVMVQGANHDGDA